MNDPRLRRIPTSEGTGQRPAVDAPARGPFGRADSAQLAAALERAAALVVEGLAASPSAVVTASRRGPSGWIRAESAAGRLAPEPETPAASPAIVYDLASVTKPVTALVTARLAHRGVLGLDDRLASLLPEVEESPVADRPLWALLAHRSGLEAHRELFAPLTRGEPFDAAAARREVASALRPDCEGPLPADGFEAVYSDLGYMLVGWALERRTGAPLDELVRREVSEPLGLGLGSARQLREVGPVVAPTETVAYRGGRVVGLVHDDNAFALSGDASSGHAGLFGRARDVLGLGEALLDVLCGRLEAFLPPHALAPFVAPRLGGSHTAGFDRKVGPDSSAGRLFGPRTFGHLGFTGTSLWMDPDAELVGVLLTNRVCPSREHLAIRTARPRVYDAIAEAFGLAEPSEAAP